jgi:hypothetical protein
MYIDIGTILNELEIFYFLQTGLKEISVHLLIFFYKYNKSIIKFVWSTIDFCRVHVNPQI